MSQNKTKALKWNDTGQRALINIVYDNQYAMEHPISSFFVMLYLMLPKKTVKAVITDVSEVSVEDLEESDAPFLDRNLQSLRPIYLYKVAFIYNDILYYIKDIPSFQLASVNDVVFLRVNINRPYAYSMKLQK